MWKLLVGIALGSLVGAMGVVAQEEVHVDPTTMATLIRTAAQERDSVFTYLGTTGNALNQTAVFRFRDTGATCYVAVKGNGVGIACVRP